jgi:hypothetical protein
MIVLDDVCEKCNKICNAVYFRRNFGNWTSGNNDIDNFIQDTQLLAHNTSDISHALEWIPYDRFYNVKYISETKFNKVCIANWIDGKISCRSNYDQSWKREDCNMFVTLKSLNNPKNIALEFINKVFKFVTLLKFLILLIMYYICL